MSCVQPICVLDRDTCDYIQLLVFSQIITGVDVSGQSCVRCSCLYQFFIASSCQSKFYCLKSEVEYAGLQQIRLSGEDNMYQNHRQKDPTVDSEVDPVQQTNRSTHHEEEAHSNYNRRDPMEILEHVKIDDALQSPISTVKNVFTDSNDNNQLSFNKEELKKVEKQLRLVFVEFYQKLLHLKDYR